MKLGMLLGLWQRSLAPWESVVHFCRRFLFIYLNFWLHWVLVAARTFLYLWRVGLFSRCSERASHYRGFSCCRAWALGLVGSVALQHVESSRNRNWTHVPCTGRHILNHWTTREVLVADLVCAVLGMNCVLTYKRPVTFTPSGFQTCYSNLSNSSVFHKNTMYTGLSSCWILLSLVLCM